MSVLLLTDRGTQPEEVLPALSQVPYRIKVRPAHVPPGPPAPRAEVVLVDARDHLAEAKQLCRRLRSQVPEQPIMAVFTSGGLITLNTGWHVDDVVLDTAGSDEVTMRLRMAANRHVAGQGHTHCRPRSDQGPLTLDASTRTATLCGERIELTYTEFEILACLARRPGQTVDHRIMLDHLYGGEPRGTTRSLHTHIRRIRAKLGPEHAGLIRCVHGIGYRLHLASH